MQRRNYYVYKHRLQNQSKRRRYCVIVTRQYEEDHRFDSIDLAGAFLYLALPEYSFPVCKIPEYITNKKGLKSFHRGEETKLLGIISGMRRRGRDNDKNLETISSV